MNLKTNRSRLLRLVPRWQQLVVWCQFGRLGRFKVNQATRIELVMRFLCPAPWNVHGAAGMRPAYVALAFSARLPCVLQAPTQLSLLLNPHVELGQSTCGRVCGGMVVASTRLYTRCTTAKATNARATKTKRQAQCIRSAHMYARCKITTPTPIMPDYHRALCPVRRGVITGIRALCPLSRAARVCDLPGRALARFILTSRLPMRMNQSS